MKTPLPFLLAAAIVFLGAAFLYTKRAAALTASRHSADRTAALVRVPHPSAPAPASTPDHPVPPPPRPAPAKGALMDRVEQKLLATVKPELLADLTAWTDDLVLAAMKRVADLSDEESAKVKAHLAATRLELQRNSLRLNLTPAKRIAAKAELTQSSDAWLKDLMGEVRFGRYEAWRKARKLADAESAASQGLRRISRALPLRPDQKDALYAGFVNAAMSPAAEAADPLTQFRLTSSISEEPSKPMIQEEAKAILTPEQWAQYEEQAKLASEGQNKMTQHLLGMMPVLLSSLQELLEESAAGEKPK